MTPPKAVEALAWVLVYAGLIALCLGLFVQREDPSPGGHLMAGGSLATALGAVLIVVRSRMGP